VASDYQSVPSPCQDPQYGQVEDYAVTLNFPNAVNKISEQNNVRIYPNPFADQTTFDYTLTNSAIVSVEIYNIVGEKVETLIHSEKQSAGNYSFKITRDMPGVYFVKVTLDSASTVERIVKLVTK
jgi:hypothetical protein